MRWRRYFPAIAVSRPDRLADNPALTSRARRGALVPLPLRARPRAQDSGGVRRSAGLYRSLPGAHHRRACGGAPRRIGWPHSRTRVSRAGSCPPARGGIDLAAFRRRCAEDGNLRRLLRARPEARRRPDRRRTGRLCLRFTKPRNSSPIPTPGGSARPRASRLMSEAFALSELRREAFGPDQLTRGT